MKYEETFKKVFKAIIDEYGMNVDIVSDEKIILVGKGFVLLFLIHFDDVNMFYICRNDDQELEKWDIDSFITASLDSNDRKGIQQENSVEKTVNNILIILSRGLKNHWVSILCGEKDWLNDYKNSQFAKVPRSVDNIEKLVISNYI